MQKPPCPYRSLVRGLLVVWALALAAMLLAGCGLAAPPALIVRDEREQLDQQRVADAAAPLLARGASVAVFVVERGDDRGDDLSRRLAAEGLFARGDSLPPLLAIYISYEPRYSELRAGADWGDRLPAPTLRTIREGQLNTALRADDPDDSVVATLAALEAEIAAGQRLERTLGLTVLAVVGGLIGVLLLARPFENLWWRLQAGWPTSAPGRLWAKTPLGRRQASRRFRRDLAAARQRLDQEARRVLEEYARVAIADEALEARRAALVALQADLARRAELAQHPSDDPDLLTAIRAAQRDYTQLTRDAGRLASSVGLNRSDLAAAAKRVGELARRVIGSFEPKNGATIGDPAAQRQLSELRAALAVLDGRRAALEQAPAATELQAQMHELRGEYHQLEQALLVLWKAAFPRAHAGYLNQQRREAAKQRHSGSSSSDGASAGYAAASAGSSSSSDYQPDYSSSSSSSSSSDGGPW